MVVGRSGMDRHRVFLIFPAQTQTLCDLSRAAGPVQDDHFFKGRDEKMAPSKLALRVLDRPLIPPVYSDRGFGVALRKRGTRGTAQGFPVVRAPEGRPSADIISLVKKRIFLRKRKMYAVYQQ